LAFPRADGVIITEIENRLHPAKLPYPFELGAPATFPQAQITLGLPTGNQSKIFPRVFRAFIYRISSGTPEGYFIGVSFIHELTITKQGYQDPVGGG
jgi:hypothetical protein